MACTFFLGPRTLAEFQSTLLGSINIVQEFQNPKLESETVEKQGDLDDETMFYRDMQKFQEEKTSKKKK